MKGRRVQSYLETFSVVPQNLKILNATHDNTLSISYPDSAGSSSTSLILNVWAVPQKTNYLPKVGAFILI